MSCDIVSMLITELSLTMILIGSVLHLFFNSRPGRGDLNETWQGDNF